MADLILTGQGTSASQIQTRVNTFYSLMDQRKPFFNRMEEAKKTAWVNNASDPIMRLAWQIYTYLYNFFGGKDPNG